ncbi:MAG: LCP family protein, partial [Patescibacteria group bacterium]|nr:LCP family protein [Patescibacteria group bacterium]
MDKRNHIDFLNASDLIREFSSPRARKIFKWKTFAPTMLALVLLIGLAYTTRAVISSNDLAQQLGSASVFEQLKHLATAGDRPLEGEEQGRINILLLGVGGENHQGGQLTDTIIVASIDPKERALGLFSIPRDLVAPIPGIGWQKINSAHAYGAAASPRGTQGAGAAVAAKTVETITSLPIHYYIKLDFEGFVKVVDALGGVRVNVPVEFTDSSYPDENYGYEPVHFNEGWQNLSGERALKYVRSRHGTANQGTDFARAARQQKVLEALLARVSALSTLLNPNKLLALSDIVGTHIETDMELWQLLRLYEIGKQINKDAIKQVVLNTGPGGLLATDTNEEGSYLLRPAAGQADFSDIQLAAQSLLGNQKILSQSRQEQNKELSIAVYNGTLHEGLASAMAQTLAQYS